MGQACAISPLHGVPDGRARDEQVDERRGIDRVKRRECEFERERGLRTQL